MVNWRVQDKIPLGTRLEGRMPITAWFVKGRRLSEFDRNKKKHHPLIKKTLKTLCRLFYFYYICICEDISTL